MVGQLVTRKIQASPMIRAIRRIRSVPSWKGARHSLKWRHHSHSQVASHLVVISYQMLSFVTGHAVVAVWQRIYSDV